MKKIFAWGMSLGFVAASVIVGPAAHAEDSSRTLQIVQAIAPGLLASAPEARNLTISGAKTLSVAMRFGYFPRKMGATGRFRSQLITQPTSMPNRTALWSWIPKIRT